MRTYWTAHAPRRNAGMRCTSSPTPRKRARRSACICGRKIGRRCEASTARHRVQVHWTEPVDRSQAYIPMASPFVSKLAAIAARAHAAHPFDVIYSHYLEPYGVAGHLAAQMTGVPHVTRMAGSDAGRLWQHPQFEAPLRPRAAVAEIVIATGAVADRAAQRGVDAGPHCVRRRVCVCRRICSRPDGPTLDLATLRSEVAQDAELSASLWGDFAVDRPCLRRLRQARRQARDRLRCFTRCTGSSVRTRMSGLVALAHGRAGSRGRVPRCGPQSSTSPTAYCKFRFFRIGGSRNSCALPGRVLLRAGFPHRGACADHSARSADVRDAASSARPKSFASFLPLNICRTATDVSRSKT